MCECMCVDLDHSPSLPSSTLLRLRSFLYLYYSPIFFSSASICLTVSSPHSLLLSLSFGLPLIPLFSLSHPLPSFPLLSRVVLTRLVCKRTYIVGLRALVRVAYEQAPRDARKLQMHTCTHAQIRRLQTIAPSLRSNQRAR